MNPISEYNISNKLNRINDTLQVNGSSGIFHSQKDDFSSNSTIINSFTSRVSSSSVAVNESEGDRYVNRSNLSDNILTAATTLPDLTGPNASMPSSVLVGSSFSISYQVQNQGTASAGYSYTYFYLSPDLNIDSTDRYLGYDYVSGIAAGSYSQESSTLTIGSNLNPGNYYLIYYIDGDGYVSESNESNNAFGIAFSVTQPDLTVQNVTYPSSTTVGSSIQFNYQVTNQGTGSAGSSNTLFYLSSDLNIDSTDIYLGYDNVSGIAAGSYSQESSTLTIGSNVNPGNYYLIYYVDGDGYVPESNENNNAFGDLITINSAGNPDLIIQNATSPTSASVGSTIQLSYGVKNQGIGSAIATTTKFYLSTDATFSTNDVLLGSDAVSTIAAGASNSETASILIANSITAGNYYLLFTADADNNLAESNETNNVVAKAITINQADLIIQNATAPTSASVGSTIQVSYDVKNQGVGGAIATTTKFYLSTDATFSTNDVLLGSDAVSTIAAGAYSSETSSIVVKNTIAGGNYYLLFRADADSNLAESNETNNVVAKAITINGPQPDLIIQNISAPSIVDPGTLITVNYQLANQGTASASTSTTKIYLSQDTALSSDDILLASDQNYFFSGLSAGTYSSESYYLSLSSNINFGNYYLLFQADANGDVSESNESNNITTKAITLAAPDLLIQNPSAPTSANIGTTISVSYQLKNQGNGNAGINTTRFYLSQDTSLSSDDISVGSDLIGIPGIAASTVISRSASLYQPSTVTIGNYYLLYQADGLGSSRESNENNNVTAQAITITAPDLVIQNFTAPTSVNIGTTFQVNYELKNQGNGSAGGSKSSFYLSRDTAFGDDDIWLGTEIEASSIVAPSAVISRSTSLPLDPIINPGKYYLIVKADGSSNVAESNETNNGVYITTPITFNPVNGGGFNSTTGYGLTNAAAAVAQALGQSTFADVPDLGGNDWGADAVKAPEVWAKGYTGQGVIVAVVDSGVDYTHPDLIANMWRNSKEIADNGNDDDGNGFIDDIYGWNFFDNNNDPLDKNGHGTHVAGTIAATRNSFGVTGIAYNAKIMALRTGGTSPSDGSLSAEAVNKSIRYAVDNGAKVINLSLGGSSTNIERQKAIEYAISKGAIVVFAAGNEGASTPSYPARYADQYGLAVGAVNYNRTLTDFSNRPGTTPLAYVTAPGAYSDYFGIGIYSTIPGGDYGLKPGTSMAAPHVAGVVALMLSAKSNLTDAQVRAILTSTAANGGTLPSQSTTSTTSSSNTGSSISSYTTASISLSSDTNASNGSNNFNNNIEQSTSVNQDVFVNKSLWKQFIRYQASNENNKFAHWEEENDGKAVSNKRKKILEDYNNWLLKLGNQVV